MEFVGKFVQFDVIVVDERKIEYVRRRNNQGNLDRRTQTFGNRNDGATKRNYIICSWQRVG